MIILKIKKSKRQQFHLMKNVSESLAERIHTAQRWLYILISSNIVYLLEPYYNNIMKRAVKTPKIYFLYTGLVLYLTKW